MADTYLKEIQEQLEVVKDKKYYLTIDFELDDENYGVMNYHAIGVGGVLVNPSGQQPSRLLLGKGKDLKNNGIVIISRFAKLQKEDAEDPDGEVMLSYRIRIQEGDDELWKHDEKDEAQVFHSVFKTKITFQ